MKKFIFFSLLLLLPVSMASADLKVATVDLGKAFDQFYKTKEAAARLKEKQEQAQKEIQDKVTDYQHISDEVQKLDTQSKDPTLSPEARADKAKARDQRGADLQAAGRQIEEFKTERGNELKDEYVRRRKEVVDEITKVINDYSGPQGFDLVLDKSSASVTSGVPFVLYNSNKLIDITPDIVAKLNAGAPAAGAATTATPDTTVPAAATTH
jgi:outer membrane protein